MAERLSTENNKRGVAPDRLSWGGDLRSEGGVWTPAGRV